MFLEKENYLILEEWKKLGVSSIYTKQNYGNVLKIDKENFLKDFKIEGKNIVSGHQTHSDNIKIIENLKKLYFENTDGFITDRRDIVIFTKYADCLPVYLFDKKKNIIGLVHSGWQGSYKEIASKAVKLMIERYDSKIEDIHIAFGVGISQDNYEVGKEFLEKFEEKFSKDIIERSFKKENNKIYYDNQYFVYLTLLNLGIAKNNIIRNNLCTFTGNFHSYRRDRENSGRNGAFIWIED